MLLENKVCIVAGASSERGIGYATAQLFAQHGASIAAIDIQMDDDRAAGFQQSLAKNGQKISGHRCDVTARQQCIDVVKAILDIHGRIDCLVNSVGIVQPKAMLDIDEADYDRMMDINLKGTFNMCQAALPSLVAQRSGAIVNVSSVAGQRGGGLVGGAHYAVSKGGILSLTRSIAREFGPVGVRANSVCPSTTQTDMTKGLSQAERDVLAKQVPLARLATPMDVAGACLFLASDLSAYVTGATIDVNGGMHIH